MDDELYLNAIGVDWDQVTPRSYLRDIPAIAALTRLELRAPVTFFAGENGNGKSTLIEAIAVAWGFNPEGGTRNYVFSTFDTHSELCGAIRLTRSVRRPAWGYFLRAESFYNVATKEEEYSRGPGGRPQHFHEKSHGESFLALVQNTFRCDGFYLLDEPEAALSPQRQLTLLAEIDRLARDGSQFIVVTHSPILLGLPGAEILSFDGGAIHPIEYEDTDSYKVTEMFINGRKRVLYHLLGE